MNIFFLDREANKAAQYHSDKHVVKMVLETAQILSTVVRIKRGYPGVYSLDGLDKDFGLTPEKNKKWKSYAHVLHGETGGGPRIYLITHPNHPSVLWARKSLQNYIWLLRLGYFLVDEYMARYEKIHKSLEVIRLCEPNLQRDKLGNPWPLTEKDFPNDFLTKPPSVMPIECQFSDDPVENYRLYYASYKKDICHWNYGSKPEWLDKYQKLAKLNHINPNT